MSNSKNLQTPSEDSLEESIYTLMYKLQAGEQMVIPMEAKGLACGYASRFKREMDRQYSIRNMETSRSKPRFVFVMRTK